MVFTLAKFIVLIALPILRFFSVIQIMKYVLQGRLTGFQRQRLAVLLDMLYFPAEIASEIGFNPRQFSRVYFPLGCPVVLRDGRRFVHGLAFADWYEATYPKLGLQDGEGFCLTCKRAVKISDFVEKKSGRLVYAVFNCSHCGRKISRILYRSK